MIEAHAFVGALKSSGLSLYAGVPCSYLTPFINHVIDAPDLAYIGAANEGDAVAIATGAALGGRPAAVLMQCSGLGNAVSPLTSLNAIFRVPVLLIITLRGEPGGPADEPQHQLMGAITTRMLELMNIAWDYFPSDPRDIDAATGRALSHMARTELPYCLVMRSGSVAPHALNTRPIPRESPLLCSPPASEEDAPPRPSRREALSAVQQATGPEDIIIATTGHTGRELYACDDRPNQLYMVGSMGCAAPLGLGLALARPDRRVIVLDGDGAILMRMGALATVGYERPANLVHVLLDNEVHDSTGAQATVSHAVDLGAVARACGYPRVSRVTTPEALATALADRGGGLRFLHLKIRPGAATKLPRPTIQPVEVRARLQATLCAR